MDDDNPRDAPPVVIGAVAAGVAPLPFLAVYAVLFIGRGAFHPVIPPDIGHSNTDELIAGLVALALFVLGAYAALAFLNGRRRWLFVLAQAATLGTCIDFLIDSTTGPPGVPGLLAVTSLVALVLAFLPGSWEHLRRGVPAWLRRRGAGRSVDRHESALPAQSSELSGSPRPS